MVRQVVVSEPLAKFGSLRSRRETLLTEVPIEAERRANSKLPHGLETYAVDHAERPPPGGQHRLHSSAMPFLSNSVHLKQGRHVFVQAPHRRHSDSMLQERSRLQE